MVPATPHVLDPKPLRDWAIMDPAVGSGHFHVVAFDMLAELYEEERRLAREGLIPAGWATPEEETARTILERNLYGIDIDSRAVQLATLALYLKGVELGLDRTPRIHMIAADAAFMHTAAWKRFVQGFQREPSVRRVLEALTESLKDIREIGSLLQPEVELQRLIAEERRTWEQQAKRGAVQLDLFPEYVGLEPRQIPFEEISDETFWENLSYRVQAAIDGFLHEARERGELVEQVVAGQALRSFAFLQFCQRRYDVVCTNPPFMGAGGMSPILHSFVARHYRAGKADLYASFVLRCWELATTGGHVAMVTRHSWVFLSSFASLRGASSGQSSRGQIGTFGGLLRDTSLETLAHLGPGAFTEISGEVVDVVLFTLRNLRPRADQSMTAFRIGRNLAAEQKAYLLRQACCNGAMQNRYVFPQNAALGIPKAPIAYWVPKGILELLRTHRRVEEVADVRRGLDSGHDERFVRMWWETDESSGWIPYSKGGGYGKWAGNDFYSLDWRRGKDGFSGITGARIQNVSYYFRPFLTYSLMAQGSLGVRLVSSGYIPGGAAGGVYPVGIDPRLLCAFLNCRLVSYLLRVVSPEMKFREGYVARTPLIELTPAEDVVGDCVDVASELKRRDLRSSLLERSFRDVPFRATEDEICCGDQAVRHSVEALCEHLVVASSHLDAHSMRAVLRETGSAAGWYPLLASYDRLPDCAALSQPLGDDLLQCLRIVDVVSLTPAEVERVKERVATLYSAGPGASDIEGEDLPIIRDEPDLAEGAASVLDECIPIPAETFLEEISQGAGIHPISVYWLLEEMRREEGLVCPPELQRQAADYFTVKLLRMLGHRWPMQDQYEEEEGHPFLDPQWVDRDGILPLTPGAGKQTLMDVMHRYLDAEFGPERGPQAEVEAGSALGWKKGDTWGQHKPTTLERWFEREFFKRHVSQFKRRPIAWHLTSPKGAFQVIVYYHRFDRNRLLLLRSRYVREVLEELRRRIGRAQAASSDRAALGRIEALEEELADVQEFDRRLQRLLEGRDREARIWCPWKSSEEQPVGWDPDINDGVRVNIAPVQRLGLLKANVLSAKDLKSLLAPAGRR